MENLNFEKIFEKEAHRKEMNDIKYTAVLIEPRQHKAFHLVLNNFLTNLSDEWGFVIFNGTKNKEFLQNLISSHFEKYKHKIQLIQMNRENITSKEYNNILCSTEIYEYIPTEIFLIFQMDTLIWSENKDCINYFLQYEYDYVGAPWAPILIEPWLSKIQNGNVVGNGGLSLRRKSKMLEIINTSKKNDENVEDLFFSFPQNCHINKPPLEMAKNFSIETIFHHKSFGIHKAWAYMNEKDLEYLTKNIPELHELMRLNDAI